MDMTLLLPLAKISDRKLAFILITAANNWLIMVVNKSLFKRLTDDAPSNSRKQVSSVSTMTFFHLLHMFTYYCYYNTSYLFHISSITQVQQMMMIIRMFTQQQCFIYL